MTTDLILSRVLKAPRAAVYACWTTPEHMVQWFMPKPHFIDDITIDLRPGGRFDSTMHVDGAAIPSRGCVLDAVQDRRFAFTDLMTADFQPVAEPGLGFTATIDLSDHEDGTLYHVTARHRTGDDAQKHETMGFTTGWGIVATQLESYAQTLAASDRTMILQRQIHATPDQVWRAWTDPVILPQWFGPAGYSCQTKDINLTPGGQWRFDMTGPDGTIWPNRHYGFTHDPLHTLTFLMDDDSDADAPMQVTVTLTPQNGGTLLTQKVVFPTAEAFAGAKAFGAVELGQTTLAKLAASVET